MSSSSVENALKAQYFLSSPDAILKNKCTLSTEPGVHITLKTVFS